MLWAVYPLPLQKCRSGQAIIIVIIVVINDQLRNNREGHVQAIGCHSSGIPLTSQADSRPWETYNWSKEPALCHFALFGAPYVQVLRHKPRMRELYRQLAAPRRGFLTQAWAATRAVSYTCHIPPHLFMLRTSSKNHQITAFGQPRQIVWPISPIILLSGYNRLTYSPSNSVLLVNRSIYSTIFLRGQPIHSSPQYFQGELQSEIQWDCLQWGRRFGRSVCPEGGVGYSMGNAVHI